MTTPPDSASPSPAEQPSPPAEQAVPERRCTHCGAALADGQDWCLDCGAAAPGALNRRTPARAGVLLVALTGVLVVAAAGAAYAALRTPAKHIVLRAGPVTTSPLTPAVTTSTTTTPAVPPPSTPATTTPAIPKATAPVVPATATPPVSTPATPPVTAAPPQTVPPPSTSTSTSTTRTASGPAPLLLDSNAASNYNPNAYADANFGDPSLAIDGDTTTSWSAQVPTEPSPGGDAGLLVDLRSAQRLASLQVVTDTPGTTFVVLAANGSKAPATVADPGWTRLSEPHAVKHTQAFALVTKGHKYRWLLLWILGVKGGPLATLPATLATAASASSSTTTTATTSSPAATTTDTLATTTTASTSTTSVNTSPLVTVDVSELRIYP